MFFQGSQAPQRPQPQRTPPPVEENEGLFYVDFGTVFAVEMQKLLRIRQQGMLCEIVFWQDAGYGL